jgi:DDE superfamily endonuclease
MKGLARRCRVRELHLVLDNSSTHSTPAVAAWLEQHPETQFHFTLTGASWLNMVEAWFGIFTCQSVRRGSFDTVRALIRHMRRTSPNGTAIRRHSRGPQGRPLSSGKP